MSVVDVHSIQTGDRMELTEQERQFIKARTRFVCAWRRVGPILLIGLGAFAAALIYLVPLMANPFAVLARLQSDSVPESVLTLSAALLPVVVLTCLLLAVAMVLLTFAAFSNERKYLAILRRCREASAEGPGTAGLPQGSMSAPDVLDASDGLLR